MVRQRIVHIQIIHFIIVYLIRAYQLITILPIAYRKLLSTKTILETFESYLLYIYVYVYMYLLLYDMLYSTSNYYYYYWQVYFNPLHIEVKTKVTYQRDVERGKT